MNLTLKERLDLQRTARIITESQYNKLLKEEDGAQKINNFIKGVKSAGIDINNNKVQLDILNKFIDADFDIDSLNPEEINEYNERIKYDLKIHHQGFKYHLKKIFPSFINMLKLRIINFVKQ